ncbi:helix-turn-helix domain-containing protein [Micromonospora sp. WMMD812]|uniref:helix-turn-helix domain-containing protein n=1 Tax=Micromonospora sp. WMMD812 TaxID=3015152 RepID=UPI00248D17F1|nr:helix-turn-helix domain-containing protein [Micromonospora sp. WMMD812]WBB70111.1 helix-turn-helix domain-containing protein [Micromonospora sp. WMMD812]
MHVRERLSGARGCGLLLLVEEGDVAEAVVSTGAVDPSERESFWHHVLADTFAAVQLERWADHREPAARLSATRRGRLLFAELEATPHVHRRTPRQIRQADAMYFQTAILTRGAATLEQEDRMAHLSPGDLVVYENSRPFTWTFTDRWAVTVLSIPHDAVKLTDSERRAMSARRLSGRDGLSGVVARLVLDLTRHAAQIPNAQSERILAHASDLAISLFATSANAEYADARQRSMLDRIKAHIETHFRDRRLTPDDIAAAANISTRYLHRLFEGEHETVARYLRGLRLQDARHKLLDPRLAGHGVAAIAHGSGFGDISGFNRAFKAAYGITPSDLRRRRGADAPGPRPPSDPS